MRVGEASFATAMKEMFWIPEWQNSGRKIAYTLLANRTMAETSLIAVDLEEVLNRLALHAQNLAGVCMCLGLDEIALPGGEGAGDLASATLLRFLDPEDTSVKWSEARGQPTTSSLLAYLRKVLEHDFLDLKKKKSYQTTVYVDVVDRDDKQGEEKAGITLDQLAAELETPEGKTLRLERVNWILKQFDGEPELKEIVELQLDPQGYNAFTNQELAELLSTTVRDIEARKKRIKSRLRRLAASHSAEAKHV
jgi:DNA-directed RNA polymerase specialized sigma24 family protein